MADSTLFKTKTVKIDTLGEYLSSVRQQLNFDVKTVGMLTQIKPSYLEDLEIGNYVRLPAEVYIRGFLKSLSEVYGIKEQILIDQYEKERGIEPASVTVSAKTKQRFNFTPKTLVITSSILVAVVALFYVVSEIRSVLVPPRLEVLEPGTDQAMAGDTVVVSGVAEIGADVLINNQAVLTDFAGKFTENLVLSPGLNIIEVQASNKFGKISKVVRQINSQVGENTPALVSVVNVTVNVGPESTWVYMEADGVVVQRGTMLAGSSRTVQAKDDILLTSANAGSTNVIYNGKDLGKLGREGEVIRNVEFSSQ